MTSLMARRLKKVDGDLTSDTKAATLSLLSLASIINAAYLINRRILLTLTVTYEVLVEVLGDVELLRRQHLREAFLDLHLGRNGCRMLSWMTNKDENGEKR